MGDDELHHSLLGRIMQGQPLLQRHPDATANNAAEAEPAGEQIQPPLSTADHREAGVSQSIGPPSAISDSSMMEIDFDIFSAADDSAASPASAVRPPVVTARAFVAGPAPCASPTTEQNMNPPPALKSRHSLPSALDPKPANSRDEVPLMLLSLEDGNRLTYTWSPPTISYYRYDFTVPACTMTGMHYDWTTTHQLRSCMYACMHAWASLRCASIACIHCEFVTEHS